MPARVDLDGSERPQEIVRRIYSADYLLRLGQQFKFDEKDSEIVAEIRKMGTSYIAMRRRENPEEFRELNRRYNKLARELKVFRQALDHNADLDVPQIMYFSALKLNQLPPQGDFPGLSKHDREQSGEPYYRELMRLLEILDKGIDDDKTRSAPKRGPRVNFGLEVIARQAAEFFAVELKGRPFTIDPHKPFKATPAYDFVKALVEPLDTVTHDDIVTAIRGAKTIRKSPKKKRSD